MNLANEIPKYFFGYGLAIFPILLIAGPMVAEIFLLLCIIFAVYSAIKEKNFKYFNNKFLLFFLLFYLVILLSTFVNFRDFDNSKSSIFYFRIPLFALSAWYILDRFKLFNNKILFFYIAFFSFLVLDSLIQYYTGKNILGNEVVRSRISSFFGEELILGGFILRIIPFFLLYLVLNNIIGGNKINFKYVILTSLSCLVVYLSGERTSFFLLILFFFTVYFINKFLRKFIIYTMFSFVIFALVIPHFRVSEDFNPAIRMFKKSYDQIIGKGEEQYEEHKKKMFNKVYIFSHDHHGHYLLSYKMFKDHLIIGTGVKGFRYLCRNKIYILEKNDGCSTHPHNTYVQILVSTGLVGFALLVFAFAFVVREIFNSRKKLLLTNHSDLNQVSASIMLSTIFVNLWPLIPSGNFFNNWLSMIYFYPIAYYFYFNSKSTS
tara:strand:+ start:2076 stop:3374 length:1299 start_codon:yes stop_codon:yes gene_type:complete